MTWRQFQLGIAAVFLANCLVSVIVAKTLAPVHDESSKLRESLANKALKNLENANHGM